MACTVFQVLVVVLGCLGVAQSLRCYQCTWSPVIGEDWCRDGTGLPESAISDDCDLCSISETRVSGDLTAVARVCFKLGGADVPVVGCVSAQGSTVCYCDHKDLCNVDTETADSSAGIPGTTAKLTAFSTVLAWISAKYLL